MDYEGYLRFVLSLTFVIGLILLVAWALRRYGFGVMVPGGGARRRERRLAVVEIAPLDTRRRLVLLRRDGVEHLVLIGGTTDLVIETGIPPAGFARMLAAEKGEPSP
ncbi:MAG: flagellar biosynthetic protein FliO [Alphaproteobacteria bacterium]